MPLKGMTTMPLQTTTSLEVTVISGESVQLRSGRALGRGAYAVVQTASSFAITHVDEDADCCGYPYWAEPVRVVLPPGARGIDVEICRGNGRSGGRGESVAAARVPVEDFTVGPPGHLHCLSYRLFSTGGTRGRNGIVNITVKRLGGEGRATAAGASSSSFLPVPAIGKAVHDAGASCDAVDQGTVPAAGVAIGYPVGISATGHASRGKGYA